MTFQYEVTEHIAVLSESGANSLEINMISYNNSAPKYDLRRWRNDPNGKVMYKGITLNDDEAHELYAVLAARFK